MASVWLARQCGDGDFSRVVAIKQLFPQYAKDPQFVAMFHDEARLAARVRHPNVVSTIDVVVADGGEVFIVMEYIAGESLSRLLAAARGRREPVDPPIAVAITISVLEGLHAAHQATNERGVPLKIVHRDMSPQNVIVGSDGVARVVDFGIAKAIGRQQETTQTGQLKGKVCYMAPEQLGTKAVDRRCDVWAVSVVLWEMLSGRQLFEDAPAALRYHAGIDQIPPPECQTGVDPSLVKIVERGLSRDPNDRFGSAREMIVALEKAMAPASTRRVAQWVQKLAKDTLRERAQLVEELEVLSGKLSAHTPTSPPSPSPTGPPPPDPANSDGTLRLTDRNLYLHDESEPKTTVPILPVAVAVAAAAAAPVVQPGETALTPSAPPPPLSSSTNTDVGSSPRVTTAPIAHAIALPKSRAVGPWVWALVVGGLMIATSVLLLTRTRATSSELPSSSASQTSAPANVSPPTSPTTSRASTEPTTPPSTTPPPASARPPGVGRHPPVIRTPPRPPAPTPTPSAAAPVHSSDPLDHDSRK